MPTDSSNSSPEREAGQAQRFTVPEFTVPKSIAEVRELARTIALGEWAPNSYRDLDDNYVQQKIELAIMHGATVGLGPIAAVQSIAVIDGMPTIWGDGALALIEGSGLLEDMAEEYRLDPDEGLTAICTMRRRYRPAPISDRFSMAMAERARLLKKEGPWQMYPERMLKMRARSWTIRDGFADVLRGLFIREEVEDFAGSYATADWRPGQTQNTWSGMVGRPRWSPLGSDRDVGSRYTTTVRAEAAEGPQATEDAESFTLADAQGGPFEVVGGKELHAAFERIFFEKHLSPDQIVGLWESNECARVAIERLFGAEALEPVMERVRSAQAARQRRSETNVAGRDHRTERKSTEERSDPGGTSRPGACEPPPARTATRISRATLPNERSLVVAVEPTWSDQKVFRHYRASLGAFLANRSDEQAGFARFRAANSAIEARLQMRLPELMQEIDALDSGKFRSLGPGTHIVTTECDTLRRDRVPIRNARSSPIPSMETRRARTLVSRHLLLIDGSEFLFRGYYAFPRLIRSDGTPVGAVYGFTKMFSKLIAGFQTDQIGVAFDTPGPNFRHRLYPEYKAQRPAPPPDLVAQLPLVRRAMRAFGVCSIEMEGFEADDLIATYTRHAVEAGAEVTIVSSDKDLMQLVGEHVKMLNPINYRDIGEAEVREKFGVGPERVVDVQALCGDSVDNVPGVPGIGVKTAAQLINTYGNLETLLAHAGEIKQPKRRDSLIQFEKQARLSKELVKLDDDAPLPCSRGI